MFKIQKTYEIPNDRVADLLCSAFDPLSRAVSYWAEVSGNKKGESNAPYWWEYPISKGGELFIKDVEADKGETFVLDEIAIQRGLQIMARDHERHMNDFISENDDNDTADVFIQCCLFGEVLYG